MPTLKSNLSNIWQRQTTIWLILIIVLGLCIYFLKPILTPFVLGAIIAYILRPGVCWLIAHRFPRILAIILMILFFLVLFAILGLLILAAIEKEAPLIQEQVPLLFYKIINLIQPYLYKFSNIIQFNTNNLKEYISEHLSNSSSIIAASAWTSFLTSGSFLIAFVINAVMVPIVAFYLLYDWEKITRILENLIPRRSLDKTLKLINDINLVLSQYLRGQLLVMVTLALYYSVCLSIAGFDIALPVGVFTGLVIFIPYLGFATGLTLALIAAILQFGSWYGIGMVALIYGFGQLLESFFLTPHLVGERIGVSPLVIIFALLAFGQLFGFFGVLCALPVCAILSVIMKELYKTYLASNIYKH